MQLSPATRCYTFPRQPRGLLHAAILSQRTVPELPEVETYRRFIDELAVGQTIAAVQVNDAHVLATPEDQLRVGLVGRAITGTSRLGKNCFLELDNGTVLVLHFGMTGRRGGLPRRARRSALHPRSPAPSRFGPAPGLHRPAQIRPHPAG